MNKLHGYFENSRSILGKLVLIGLIKFAKFFNLPESKLNKYFKNSFYQIDQSTNKFNPSISFIKEFFDRYILLNNILTSDSDINTNSRKSNWSLIQYINSLIDEFSYGESNG